jgi:phage shock protein A
MAAGTLSRVANIIRADMDDLLCRMEDPDKMARLMMTEMENAVNDAVAAVADAMAGQRLLERRVKARRADAAGWDGTAERAVSRGDDDLARLALERKAAIEAEAEGLEKALDEAGKVTAQLERQCARLKDRFQEARARQRTLVARSRAAGSCVSAAGSPARIREEAFERFDAFCQRVDHEEAAAEVYEEIAGNTPDVDDRLEKMARKERIDTQLREMKQKLADAKSEPDGQ